MHDPPVTDGVVKCNPLELWPLKDQDELEKLAVFAVCVDGRAARMVWPKVCLLLAPEVWWAGNPRDAPPMSPFEIMSSLPQECIHDMLVRVRMGQYNRIAPALKHLGDLPRNWTWRDLHRIGGVNLKTAKLVELYRWPGQECACLDVHVLRAMRDWPLVRRLGIKIPSHSPQQEDVYSVLEAVFLAEARRRNAKPWQLDKKLWVEAMKKKGAKGV